MTANTKIKRICTLNMNKYSAMPLAALSMMKVEKRLKDIIGRFARARVEVFCSEWDTEKCSIDATTPDKFDIGGSVRSQPSNRNSSSKSTSNSSTIRNDPRAKNENWIFKEEIVADGECERKVIERDQHLYSIVTGADKCKGFLRRRSLEVIHKQTLLMSFR